ncbi:uncharacterized protein METZ01_LOCUS286831, partial [marine metagenome]
MQNESIMRNEGDEDLTANNNRLT